MIVRVLFDHYNVVIIKILSKVTSGVFCCNNGQQLSLRTLTIEEQSGRNERMALASVLFAAFRLAPPTSSRC